MHDALQVDVPVASRTAGLARRLIGMRGEPPPQALRVVKQCLLDWLGVTLAARHEPLVSMLVAELAFASEAGESDLIGFGRRVPLMNAVLINGAAGHALDFDDVILPMGHPTAPVAPAVLGLAQAIGSSGAETLGALIAGIEAECRIARLMGPSHYARGWHSTATFGAFGAASAAAHLMRLDEPTLRQALGLAGTQAAGLKSVFGTMSKPLHAGKAAQNGVLAARLAARGFTSDPDILDSQQGFASTQSASVDPSALTEERPLPWVTDALFKFHAACYLTHNTIEAAGDLRRGVGFSPDEVEAVLVQVQGAHLGVCNIEAPRTGLECKFSLRMTCAMALADDDTFDEGSYSDETAQRPDLVALRQRISVEPTAAGSASTVNIRLRDGRAYSRTVDVGVPERDLDRQQAKLERKFRHLTREALWPGAADEVVAICQRLEEEPTLERLMRAIAGGLQSQ